MWGYFHSDIDRLTTLAVGRNLDSRLEVFGTGSDGSVWHTSQNTVNSWWTPWQRIYQGATQLRSVAVALGNSDLQAFGVAADGSSWHASAPQWVWSQIGSVGLHLRTIIAVADTAGMMHAFAVSASDAVWHSQEQSSGTRTVWNQLTSPTQKLQSIAATLDGDGRLHVFGASSGEPFLSHLYQGKPGGSWSSWEKLGPGGGVGLLMVAAALDSQSRPHAFATGVDGSVWHAYEETSGRWSQLGRLGATHNRLQTITATLDRDGRLHAFATAQDDTVWHVWETVQGGAWSYWLEVYSGRDKRKVLVTGNDFDGRIHLFGTAADASLWHTVAWEHRIHLLGVPLRDDPADLTPIPAPIANTQFAAIIEGLNYCYSGTGVQFVFDLLSDWEPLADTIINRDGPTQLTRGNAFAATRPGRIVCFFRFGSGTSPTGNGNAYPPVSVAPVPANVPSHEQNYVALPNFAPNGLYVDLGRGSFLAHELGHYLGLHHTFLGWNDLWGPIYQGNEPASAAAADQTVIDYIAAHGGTVAALDGDGIADTPPDPSPVLFRAHGYPGGGGDICANPTITVNGTSGGNSVSFTFTPDPNNVMSYYGGCPPVDPNALPRTPPQRFSPQQIVRIHQTLRDPLRRHLLRPPPS